MDVNKTDAEREMRGRIYLARLRVDRLEGAWPDPAKRIPDQSLALVQARQILELLEQRAAELGIEPWAAK